MRSVPTQEPSHDLEQAEAHYARSPFVREVCLLDIAADGADGPRLHAIVLPDVELLRERRITNVRDLVRFELETWAVTLPPGLRATGFDVLLEPLARTATGAFDRAQVRRAWRAAAEARAPQGAAPSTGAAVPSDPLEATIVGHVRARARAARVERSSHLDLDLGFDSIGRVELLTALEGALDRTLEGTDTSVMATVGDLVEAFRRAPTATHGDGTDTWRRLLDAPLAPDVYLAELRKSKWGVALAFFVALHALGWIARVLVGLRVRGTANLPRRGPYLICPNHQSYVDGFLLSTAFPLRTLQSIFFVGATEYFATPFTAWLARLINLVPVDPDANLVRAMQVAAAGLRLGRVLVIFPEGERSIDGDLKPFRRGGAILSSRLAVPIVPVAIAGAFDLWPRGHGIAWRLLNPLAGHRVHVHFGAPFVPGQDGVPGDEAGLATYLQARVAALRAEARSDGRM